MFRPEHMHRPPEYIEHMLSRGITPAQLERIVADGLENAVKPKGIRYEDLRTAARRWGLVNKGD